ncbi:replication enhancer protein [Stachytarpheta leaf curl virus]|uniref:Replication enhancer n=1 Tax=Stachytarpheta leaf curl virus - [Hn5] TaxID=223329 RepID=Q8JLL8_9GEMI|nr:replication enhancer protein [Stachytarpheta leaf curl virus]CAD42629.1 replication enhancer protein [Stachytarpheta leaf curl virus - [Hn5]]
MDFRTGEPITAAQAENGVYIWTVRNPLYFKITQHDQRPFSTNHDVITLQVQFNYNLRKALGIHQCFLICRIWTHLRPQTWCFLKVFKYQCIKYLDNLGVISINNVIRAFSHVLYNVLEGTIDEELSSIIKFNFY